jgi:peroxiredoxin
LIQASARSKTTCAQPAKVFCLGLNIANSKSHPERAPAMKNKLFVALTIVSLSLFSPAGLAAEKSDAKAELKELISKIQTKLRQGDKTEAGLADEIKEFDALLARHKGEKTDDVAQILYMKAMLYEEVLKDAKKGDALMQQLERDFPESEPAKRMKQQAEAKKLSAALVEGAKFPDFAEKDVAGKSLSIANYKGKVVLIDFWATWCGPCVRELPNVIKTYEAHHKQGFEIIGISLDKDQQKLTDFTQEKNMTWQQYFDGLMWKNKLAVKYGVASIPATYLLDGEGKIIGKDLRGEALEEAVTKALANSKLRSS